MNQFDINKLRTNRIIMFGTGKMGRTLWNYLKERDAVSGFFACLDNDKAKWGTEFEEGLRIFAPEDLPKLYLPGTLVLVSTVYYMDVVEQLEGIMPDLSLEDVVTGISIKIPYEDDPEETAYDSMAFEDVKPLLADGHSRELLDFVLEVRSRGISLYSFAEIEKLSRNMWYWQNVERVHGGRAAVVDCGAYTGDSIGQIWRALNGRVDRYYALEPDEGSFGALMETERDFLDSVAAGALPWTGTASGVGTASGAAESAGMKEQKESDGKGRKLRADFFKNIKKGAWNRSGTLNFIQYERASASSFSENQNLDEESGHVHSVDVMRIDDLDLWGFDRIWIKMDIEGSELNALRGATELIRTKAPDLAVCAYHRSRDLVNIPMLIHELNPDYEIRLRGGIHYVFYAHRP